ncbi:MAG: translation initiation factor IF-3 [Clostridiales bacterium]|nr:translation initiation factor IF-3 [Clostridiales bacterium]
MEVFTIAKTAGNQMINDDITFEKVRLIDAEGQMVGVVTIEEARAKAYEAELDLVLISANPDNPVCRIQDYGKFLFEQNKKDKEQKKKQKQTEVKEVGLKLTTDTHDIEVKRKAVIKFLGNGDRVKVNIRFRGREMAFQNKGYEVMEKFAEGVSEFGQIDKQPKIEGRNMVMYISPLKKK